MDCDSLHCINFILQLRLLRENFGPKRFFTNLEEVFFDVGICVCAGKHVVLHKICSIFVYIFIHPCSVNALLVCFLVCDQNFWSVTKKDCVSNVLHWYGLSSKTSKLKVKLEDQNKLSKSYFYVGSLDC